MTRQEKRGLSDLRHRNRKIRLEKYRKNKEEQAVQGREFVEAQVVSTGSGRCEALSSGGMLTCRTHLPVAPGDYVALTAGLRVTRVLPRTSVLSRPDPGNPNRELVVAANMDLVVIVSAAADPPPRPGLIDRYLIATERGGAAAAICINKCELARPEFEEELAPYRELGLPVVICSAITGTGLDDLRAVIAGKLCVFAGHSGVGKSSLLNALLPEAEAVTGAVNEGSKRGRHTTTGSRIYDLGDGARVMDTPGIREFGMWKLAAEDVRFYFHDFDQAAASCRFSDCSHMHEPQCAVRRQVELGLIPSGRYARYLRLCEGEDR